MFNYCARDGDTSTPEDTERAIKATEEREQKRRLIHENYSMFLATLTDRPQPKFDMDEEIPFQHPDDLKLTRLG